MNALKLKIWDGEKMLYGGETSLQNDSGGWPYLRINLHNYFKPHCRDFKVLQWAGIKDSKGKDIYLGDVVKCYFNTRTEVENIGVIEFSEKYGVVGVKVTDARIYVAAQEIPKPFFNFITNSGELLIEVIGNIYENSEILKNEK